MVSRKMLQTMFSLNFQAETKLTELERYDTFAACSTCNESPSYQMHLSEMRWLDEKTKLMDLLIDIYLSDR